MTNVENILVNLEKLRLKYKDNELGEDDLVEILVYYKKALLLYKNMFYQPKIILVNIGLKYIKDLELMMKF